MFQAWLKKYRKDGGELRTQHPTRGKRHEEDNRDGDEAEDRHRLKNVQELHKQNLGAFALGCQRRVGEGEY